MIKWTKQQKQGEKRWSSRGVFADVPGISAARTKILLLTDAFLPHAGGSREYYFNIYRELVALGDSEVTILTKKVPGWREFDGRIQSSRLRISRFCRPLPSLKYRELPKGIFPFLQALWRVFCEPPAIIHAGDLYPQGLSAYALKKVFDIPYVMFCHGEEITQANRYRYQPRVRNCIYKAADAVIANSDFAHRLLLGIGVSESRIHKITPGVDVQRFRPAAPNKALLRQLKLEDKKIILTVARLVPRKGHQAALQAFSRVCREFPAAHYVIVGAGPEEARLRQVVRSLNLHERVTFNGLVSEQDLPDFYRLCDVMLMPNRQEADGDIEGFGIVFLEANATGKPVIGGRSGGTVETIVEGITGYLVNPDDPEEIAAALRRLLSDRSLCERMGTASVERMRDEFGWQSRAQMLQRINEEILLRQNGQSVGTDIAPHHLGVSRLRKQPAIPTEAQEFRSEN